ncbi:MAG: hypothetical protein V3U96_07970 [Paracoccaceae bacterium]
MSNQSAYPITNFVCKTCGENSYALAEGGGSMGTEHIMSINGDTDLSACVTGKSDACVYTVRLVRSAGWPYKYSVQVDAKGPKGSGSGWLNLVFEDVSGDRYKLGIYSSGRKTHAVSYSSKKPDLVRMDWSN